MPIRAIRHGLAFVLLLIPNSLVVPAQQIPVPRHAPNAFGQCDRTVVLDQSAFALPDQVERRRESADIYPVNRIVLVGLIEDREWRVVLEDISCQEIVLAREGDTAFGYRVKQIIPASASAVLESAGKRLELRTGRYNSAAPLSDGTAVAILRAPHNVEELRHKLSTLGPLERHVVRERIRNYWREQWQGGLGNLVSTLKPEDQVRIRAEISSYWQK